MPIEEKVQLSQRAAQDNSKLVKNDLMTFLTDYTFTLDEHDKINPIKKLPMDKEYIKDMATLFLNERLLIIEKSRQMLVTWIGMAYCLWMAMFHPGQRIAVQSKKEGDARIERWTQVGSMYCL